MVAKRKHFRGRRCVRSQLHTRCLRNILKGVVLPEKFIRTALPLTRGTVIASQDNVNKRFYGGLRKASWRGW